MNIVATAGHVDHGKSTLVLALTGMDPDRFAEEKARGLTIDLGFAWTTLPSGRTLAFVDVPGHVRFLKNMLAGLGGIDAALFVVAATEGWKPQSEEHLRILDLLGVRFGLVALTKVSQVDEETVELARIEVAEATEGTFLATAPVIAVDALAGYGLEALREALDLLVSPIPKAQDRGRPRLWIDRAFAAKGSGTVVTGTLTGGRLALDDELVLIPGSRRVRVRALQALGQATAAASPGSRVAVNLTGATRNDLKRGDALVRSDQWRPSAMVDATLRTLPNLTHELSRRGAYQAYIGSGEFPVRLRVLGAEVLRPGTEGLVRLHLPCELSLTPGDRFILRESGRDETVGGGEILDVAPVLAASRARPSRSVSRVVAERGWVESEELERLTGESRPATVGRWVVDPPTLEATAEEIRLAVASAGALGLDVATLDEKHRALLDTLEDMAVQGGRARSVGAQDSLPEHPFIAVLEAARFTPPEPIGVPREELRELVRRGLVVERDGCHFAPGAIDEAIRLITQGLITAPQGLTVAQVRDLLGTTRKHALPLLALLDATGVTRRQGDLRVAGPRLARTER